jgi:hypothetical protein
VSAHRAAEVPGEREQQPPDRTAFVSFNNTPNAFSAAANSGASVSPEILGGRLVLINRGAAWPGVEALRFNLHENPTITLQ